ncbi:hypothetical protein D9M68_676360 [compost metagenome]
MPTVLALAMLWPITSRLRLAVFRPERPCWKAMVMSLESGMKKEPRSHEAAGLVVGHGSTVGQLQRDRPVGEVDRIDALG